MQAAPNGGPAGWAQEAGQRAVTGRAVGANISPSSVAGVRSGPARNGVNA
jgi:hypothetical protein